MAQEVVMPALEMSQEFGRLVRWLKAEGEKVQKGEPLMEIETDKALVEIESPSSGILSAINAHAGDEVPVGQVIALVLTEPEHRALSTPTNVIARSDANDGKGESASRRRKMEVGDVGRMPAARGVVASPKARRLAAEHGINLQNMK